MPFCCCIPSREDMAKKAGQAVLNDGKDKAVGAVGGVAQGAGGAVQGAGGAVGGAIGGAAGKIGGFGK